MCRKYTSATHVFCVSTDVVGSFRIICAFCEPPFNGFTAGGSVVLETTVETASDNH